ncbi:MAG: FtsB family cell division protein [Sporichthyaceae bacterium]
MKVPRRSPAPRPTARDRARPGALRSRGRRTLIPAQAVAEPVITPGSGGRSPFTRRAVVVAVVLFATALSVAYPAQRLVAQRADIAELRAQVSERVARVADLERDLEAVDQPYYIEREARRRLHFVLPGEAGFRVTDPPLAEQAGLDGVPGDAPWWDRLFSSVAEASTPNSELPVGDSR